MISHEFFSIYYGVCLYIKQRKHSRHFNVFKETTLFLEFSLIRLSIILLLCIGQKKSSFLKFFFFIVRFNLSIKFTADVTSFDNGLTEHLVAVTMNRNLNDFYGI